MQSFSRFYKDLTASLVVLVSHESTRHAGFMINHLSVTGFTATESVSHANDTIYTASIHYAVS